jgi:serine protease
MRIFLCFISVWEKCVLKRKGVLDGTLLFIIGCLLFLTACNRSSGNGSGYTLSGTVSIPGHTAVDKDVNDAYHDAPQPESNNSFEEAQNLLSTPVILGGFVTVAKATACAGGGRLCSKGDPNDFYRVTLSGEHTINLYVSDDIEISLHLFDQNQNLLDSDSGSSENLTLSIVNASGNYYIQVEAHDGASNYIMAVTSSATTSDSSQLNPDQDFIPGEFIVRFKDVTKNDPSVYDSALKAKSLGLTVAFQSNQSDSGPILVRMPENRSTSLYKNLKIQSIIGSMHKSPVENKERMAKLETIQTILAMRQRSDVLYAEPNYIRKIAAIFPNDEFYGYQWHYPLIYLPDAWELIPDSSASVVVAVVDTGVLMEHPDLNGQLTSDGYDFISDPTRANDGDGRDDNPNDPGDKLHNGISSFHGTHVSGTIAAATDNNSGVAGVTWRTQTKIMPLRALGLNGEGTSFDILEAVKYAARLPNVSGLLPDQKADIINLSLGGSASSAAEEDVYRQVRDQGVIIVAAAGNESSSTPIYPASYDDSVVSVSAVDSNAELTPYSNYGATVDIAAPGGDLSKDLNDGGDGYPDGILSTLGDDSGAGVTYEYSFLEGTSMATPHVTGVAALMKAVSSNLTPDNFDSFLINGDLTTDIGEIGEDTQFGNGLIDAYSAVLSAQGGEIPTVLKVSPKTLDFGSELTNLSISAKMMGSDTLSITSVNADASWIDITPRDNDLNLDTDPNTDIPSTIIFDVQIERPGGFSDGINTATITFETTANTIDVPVSMQIASTDPNSDAGFQYIMLIDPDTQNIRYQIGATVQNGRYYYQFKNVARGRYLLAAGTDMDNDLIIGESGEAFGMYLSKEKPMVINVTSNLTQLDFLSGFPIRLTSDLGAGLKHMDGIPTGKDNHITIYK